jgi:hypothetical protein
MGREAEKGREADCESLALSLAYLAALGPKTSTVPPSAISLLGEAGVASAGG